MTNSFWRTVIRLDKSKINTWIAFRNSLAVALPLGIGIAFGNAPGTVAITVGALNVSYSDGSDPYRQRARRMLAWSLLGALAVFIGSVTGSISWLAVLLATLWAFLAGMLVSVSTRAGDLGLNTLVALIVFAARGALSLKGAAIAASLVLAGGLLQMLFALILWPLRGHGPERHAIGQIYLDLSKELDPSSLDPLSTPLAPASAKTQDVLSALGNDHSTEGERYRMLFDQAERIRLSTFLLRRLRLQLMNEPQQGESARQWLTSMDRLFLRSASVLAAAGHCLTGNRCLQQEADLKQGLNEIVYIAHSRHHDDALPLAAEISAAMDVLAGQLREVLTLTSHSATAASEEFGKTEVKHPWRLQVKSWLGTLAANLDPRSAYFRHAIRIAACVAIADGIGRVISWQRSYWIPMTVAVILKPDFTATFSRGILRLTGTLSGLLLATAIYHLLPASAFTQLLLVGGFTFFLRSLGPANYGVFSVAVSGLIVFLLAATGVPPAEVVWERALNTTAGGLFALLAYALWPTWERTQTRQTIAEMIDALRAYFHAVTERLGSRHLVNEDELDKYRKEWRRTRSNAEASVDRLAAEPRTSPEQLSCFTSVLSSSHAAMHSSMGLEAGLLQDRLLHVPAVFAKFTHDIEFTLYYLASALRGSAAASETLPQLRQDHRLLLDHREEFVPDAEFLLSEADRLTVSVNTLRERVIRLQP